MNEDQLINYILHRIVKSFYYLNKIGYHYITNKLSITKTSFEIDKRKLKYIFIYLKIIFEYSKNIKYEKDMTYYLLNKLYYYFKFVRNLSTLNQKEFNFYYNIILKMLNCTFITNENKFILNKYKDIIKKNA